MIIKVDTRESSEKLFDAFDIVSTERGFQYEKVYLEVGDVVYGNVVIERKQANDFVASIMDRRLKEQAKKMSMNYPSNNKYVIIEGNPFHTQSAISRNAIIGQMVSLSVRHDIKIISVENELDFVYACYSIFKKHEEDANANDFDSENPDITIDKLSEEDIVTAMIFQIPNIGIDKAREISALYNFSIKNLILNVTKEELCAIDGIGSKTADKIISIFND